MAIRTYKVTLDSKNSIAPEPVYLRQGDKTGAVVIDAMLMDNGIPVSLEGLTPMFKANTADGQAVIIDSTGFNIIDASGGEFTYQVPSQLGSVDGKIKIAYFSFSDSAGAQSTFNVAFIVKKAADMTQESAKDWVSSLSEIIGQYNQWANDAHNSWEQFVNDNKEIIESIDPGGKVLSELIDFRHSDMLNKSFPTARKRGDFFDQDLVERGINPSWYGAVGDGIHDDTAAIQAALGNAVIHGKRIDLDQNAEYVVTDTIKVSSYSVINGNGARITPRSNTAFTVFDTEKTGYLVLRDIISVDTSGDKTFFTGVGDTGMKTYLRGFKLNNIYLSGYKSCVEVNYAKQWEISGCRFEGITNGILIKNKSVEMNITDTLIFGENTAGSYGIKLTSDTGVDTDYPEGMMISGCTIDNFDVSIDISDVFVANITNSYIGSKSGMTASLRFGQNKTTHNEEITITNCVFSGNGIKFDKTVAPPTHFNATITSCVFSDLLTPGVYFGGFASDVTVSECRFYGNADNKPVMIVAQKDNLNITINNVFGDSNFSAGIIFNGTGHRNIRLSDIDYNGNSNAVYASVPVYLNNIPYRQGPDTFDMMDKYVAIDSGAKSTNDILASLPRDIATGQRGQIRLNFPVDSVSSSSIININFPDGIVSPSGKGWSSIYISLTAAQFLSVTVPFSSISDISQGNFSATVSAGSFSAGYHGFFEVQIY